MIIDSELIKRLNEAGVNRLQETLNNRLRYVSANYREPSLTFERERLASIQAVITRTRA